jgi:hypothetical protein
MQNMYISNYYYCLCAAADLSSLFTAESSSRMNQQQQLPLSMHDPPLLVPLLRHPSISQNQQVLAALLQTSQQLQAAVAELLAGQLPVVLHINQLQQAHAFVQWLKKHAGLLLSVELQVPCRFWY